MPRRCLRWALVPGRPAPLGLPAARLLSAPPAPAGSLTDRKGKILVPGIHEAVAPVTEEELELYDKIDFDLEEYAKDVGTQTLRHSCKVRPRPWPPLPGPAGRGGGLARPAVSVLTRAGRWCGPHREAAPPPPRWAPRGGWKGHVVPGAAVGAAGHEQSRPRWSRWLSPASVCGVPPDVPRPGQRGCAAHLAEPVFSCQPHKTSLRPGWGTQCHHW